MCTNGPRATTKRIVQSRFRTVFAGGALVIVVLLMSACASSASPVSSVVSPALHTYDSYEELCSALGYDMLRIGGGGLDPVSYATIDDTIGQIEYQGTDAELLLRMAKDTDEDITGVGQVNYQVTDHKGSELHVGAFKDVLAAWITSGSYTYALSATGMNPDDFQDIANQLADAVTSA